MNILLFTTGGTIGSAFDGAAIDVLSDGGCPAAAQYLSENARARVQFDIKSPLNILSESVAADDLNTLAEALYEEELSAYDGVILTVGSDNLAYLSAFVGLLFGGGVPICLVASDKVLSDPTANGTANFNCAVELIRQGRSGVFVPYRSSDGVMVVHSATDIRQADLSDDFVSFHGAYGVFDNGVLHEKQPYAAQHIPPVFDRAYLPRIADNVLLLHPYPLQDYGRLDACGVKAALHTLYHSATLDSERFIPWMKAHPDFPVFLASFRSGRKLYQTAADAIEAGAVPLFDIAPECAYIKLLLACAQGVMSIKEFMAYKPSP